MKFTHLIVLASIITVISGCSSLTDTTTDFQDQTAGQIYQGGELALAKNEYSRAIKHFEALDTLYPFTENTEQAQLDLMYAYYQSSDNASAAATAERFIRLYPRSAHTDYAYYLKGLANFEQDRGWFLRYAWVDLSKRDPGSMRQAFNDFSQLVQLYPHSSYAPDARQRMIYLRNMFAEYELHVADYYLKRGAFVAAANRANYLVQHFDGTPQIEQALDIMIKSYRNLGLQQPAEQALQVLRLNFPRGKVLQELVKA